MLGKRMEARIDCDYGTVSGIEPNNLGDVNMVRIESVPGLIFIG
jgi:hypothetical protein